MYNPTTRLLTILELLQAHRRLSGAQLARRLEVGRRTVRRYILMLQDMGIPIETERGPEGGYYLGRSYKMPPLLFNPSEAFALVLGLQTLQAFQLPADVAAIAGALAKVERVLPAELLDQVQAVQAAFTFSITPPPAPLPPGLIALLSTAVQQQRRVALRYQAFDGAETQREFDLYGIVYLLGAWYGAGYCYLRQAQRILRLERILAVDVLEPTFTPPSGFDALEYVLAALTAMPGPYAVEIVLHGSLAQVEQALLPTAGTLEATADGVIWRRTSHNLRWIAERLLRLDLRATIRQPPELRALLRELAAKAQRLAAGEP